VRRGILQVHTSLNIGMQLAADIRGEVLTTVSIIMPQKSKFLSVEGARQPVHQHPGVEKFQLQTENSMWCWIMQKRCFRLLRIQPQNRR